MNRIPGFFSLLEPPRLPGTSVFAAGDQEDDLVRWLVFKNCFRRSFSAAFLLSTSLQF